MKYIDAEKLKAEIEERIALLKGVNSKGDYAKGSIDADMGILEYIDSLQQEQPQGLDEAAEDFGKRQGAALYSFAKKFFKAGAEWMAGQGETHEHYVIREVADHDIGPAIVCYPDTFEIGDKVVVQIRKK